MIETYRGVAFSWLCDQQGHLTTSQYMLMFDVSGYHLIDRLGDSVRTPDLGWADVRHEVDYSSEVPVGGLVLIRSEIVRIGQKSITHRHVMTTTDQSRIHATTLATTVRFDKVARAAVVIDDAIRATAKALMAAPSA